MPENPQPIPLQYETKRDSRARRVGLAQRFLVRVFVLLLLASLSWVYVAAVPPSPRRSLPTVDLLIMASFILWFVLVAFFFVGVSRLVMAMGEGVVSAVIYSLVMLIPLVNIVMLMFLIDEATRYLRRAGIRVGVMGARRRDLL